MNNWDVESNYQFGNNILGKKIIQNENHTKNLQLFYKKNIGMQHLQT